MKFEDMTAAHEAAYIYLAQQGVEGAANTLFMIYIDEVMKQHNFSAIGTTPRKLGYNLGPFRRKFMEHSGELFINYYKALMSYDYRLRSKKAKLPFLAYLRTTIDFRALDVLEEEQEYAKQVVTYSQLHDEELKKGYDKQGNDIVEEHAWREYIYNPEKEERKQQELEAMVDDLIKKAAEDSKNAKMHAFVKGYIDVCNEPDGDDNTMSKVGERIVGLDKSKASNYTSKKGDASEKGKKDPRTIAYYWQGQTRNMVQLDPEQEERYNDIMRQYAE